MTMPKTITTIVAAGALALLAAPSHADWELYDDFNDGIIDLTLWSIDDSSAIISEVGGVVRFVTLPNAFNDSAWLKPIVDVASIRGIRARVGLLDGCVGDVRGRLGAYVGVTGDGSYNWGQIGLRTQGASGEPADHMVQIGLSLDSGPPDYTELHDELWAHAPGYGDTIVTNEWITLTMTYNDAGLTVFSSTKQPGGSGKTHSPPLTPVPAGEEFAGIGTRTREYSGGAAGNCTVGFDDVEVFRVP